MKYTPKEIGKNVNVSRASPLKEFIILLGGLLGIIITVYVLLGLIVDVVAVKMSPQLEQKLGALFEPHVKETKQNKANVHIQRVLDELLDTSILTTSEDNRTNMPKLRSELEYKVNIVPSSQVNAMALPGGRIIIYSSLIEEVGSENELVFILAHELGHFAHRDHLRGLGRSLVLLVMSVTLLGSDSSATQFLLNSLHNVEMKFSQQQEKNADLWALDLLQRRYGHVAGSTDFFERMSKKDKRGRMKYYFATHPYPLDRLKFLEERIQNKGYQLKAKSPLDSSLISKSKGDSASQ